MFDLFSQKSPLVPKGFALFASVAIGLSAISSAPALPLGFIDESSSTGWSLPTGFTFDQNGRQFVWEKAGRVFIVAEDGSRQLLINIVEEVGNWRDYGLLGFALDPEFLTNGRFYLFYVVDRHHLLNYGTSSYDPAADEYFDATIARITRYEADPSTGFTTVVPGSRTVLLGESKSTGIPILHTSHGAGALIFGEDGSLLASAGDGASYVFLDDGNAVDTYATQAIADGIIQPKEKVGAFRSQLVDSLSGKILRINPETGDGYSSNPFFDSEDPRAPRSRVWTLGIRNAYKLAMKPGSGSNDPADADPGTLIFGDVGWNLWEEMNVVESGGENCGWPLFEGLEPRAEYMAARTYNLDAPNPLAGTPGCTETHFAFQDLLKQAQKDHTPAFPNPCNPAESVPGTIPHFMHHRPIIEWKHGADITRVPVYEGNDAAAISIDDPESPVSGPRFRGNASTTGFWHTGVGLPESYIDVYFHADHVRQWIRTFRFDPETGELASEAWFTTLPGRISSLGMNPVDGTIHYIDYDRQEVRKLVYIGNTNRKPKAIAAADKHHGPSPLTVTFDANESFDPDGDAISYSWDFGDGSTSSEIAPTKTFSGVGGAATRYDVTLTVTDSEGASRSTSLIVTPDNSPPSAVITSPADGSRYHLGSQSSAHLSAVVIDAEQPASTLSYRWQVILHHDDHVHPEPVIESPEADVTLSATPVSAEFYAYEITLEVTDDQGLSTRTCTWLYPNDTGVSTALTPVTGETFAPGVPITLEANPSEGASRVIYRANGIPVANSTTAPFTATWTPPAEGEYSIVAHMLSGGVSSVSLASRITVTSATSTPLPEPWQSEDIGDAPIYGKSEESGGVFTLKSTGGETWETEDDFHFAYKPLVGDGQITARILGLSATHKWAKAGLMLRSSTAPDSPHAFVALTADKGVALYSRPVVAEDTDISVRPDLDAPRWLRIVRSGNLISAFHSENGLAWVPVKTISIDLGEAIYVGMAIAPITGSIQGTAIFDNISTEFGNVGSDWQVTDLTAEENPTFPGSFQNGTGSFVQTGTNSFTVTGAGDDVYGTADEFNFVRQSLSGDGEIIAQVVSIDAPHPWAKAGVMVRSSTAPDAAHAFMSITPERGAGYVFRPTDGGSSTLRRHPIPTAPHWVRLVRTGDTVSGFHSLDGQQWIMVSTESIALGEDIEVGLAVTSHEVGVSATADFENVTITGFGDGNGNVPPQVAVGSPTDGATATEGEPVTLAAWFSDSDGDVVSVGYYANGQLVGQIDSAPWTLETVFTVAGDYEIVAAAVDDQNAVTFSDPITLTVTANTTPPPAPWVSTDIGPTVAAGSASSFEDLIILKAAGEEIFGTQDSFFFLHQPLDGDGEIVAEITGLSATHSWAKAGLMIRQDLTPASPHATVALTPDKGALLLSRPFAAAETGMIRHPLASAPRWVKLTRTGNTFAAFHSEDGQSWILISQVDVPIFQQALVGLAFTARSTTAQGIATIDNVSFSPAPPPAPLPTAPPAVN